MESIETLIPDNEGNHLVVVLNFYEDCQKTNTFQIPAEFSTLEIADITIEKIFIGQPIGLRVFHKMCHWLVEQFLQFPNAVFTFICSTDSLKTNHENITPAQYRWKLFEYFFHKNTNKLQQKGVEAKSLIVGPEGYQSFARVFYRTPHAPIIHLVVSHLEDKYRQ